MPGRSLLRGRDPVSGTLEWLVYVRGGAQHANVFPNRSRDATALALINHVIIR